MTESRRSERVDGWLRRELDPGPAASQRVAAGALRPRSARARRAAAPLAVFATALLVAAAVGLWRRGPTPPEVAEPAAESIRIASFGGLIAVIDPDGGARLRGTPPLFDDASPRLIVKLGGIHAD